MATVPRVSIVVPFRNASRTLATCLGSLLSQDYDAFEVIAVDDASSDASPRVAVEVRAIHPRGDLLRLLARAERGGAQRARMDGVEAARGAIVVMIDADCEAPRRLLSLAEEHLTEGVVAIGGQYRVPAGLPLVARFETRSLLDYWYRHMRKDTDHVATGCCAVWRHHLTSDVMSAGLAFRDITSGDDTAMSLALTARGPLRYVPEMYVYHHARTSLAAYLGQQVRRGMSRSRISLRHFDEKVRKARDTRMGLVAVQIAATYAGLLSALILGVWGPRLLAPLCLCPFAALQIPLLLSCAREGEGPLFLLAALPLAALRNLAWGYGGANGCMSAARARLFPIKHASPDQDGQPA